MRYATPHAFKAALEDRLRNRVTSSHDLNRLRQLVVYDRFLCRILTEVDLEMVLKGGVVLELRLPIARATKDIDLRAKGRPQDLLEALQRAARSTIDPLRFEVSVDPKHPAIEADGMIYDGLRFRVACTLAGKVYGRRFGLDVAFADPIYGGAPETLPASTWFAFADLPGVPIPVVPLETHVAEKLHAYTLPRTRPNSRLKDLPDLALLSMVRTVDAAALRDGIRLTFEHRNTHAVPLGLPDPPAEWCARYPRFAQGARLPWESLGDVLARARSFLDPMLAGGNGRWSPDVGRWTGT